MHNYFFKQMQKNKCVESSDKNQKMHQNNYFSYKSMRLRNASEMV